MAGSRTTKRPAYADYADREVSEAMAARAAWLSEVTGYEVDALSIQIALGLDKPWRESDAFQAMLTARRAAKQAERDEVAARVAARQAERVARMEAELEAARAKLAGAPAVTDEVATKRAAKAAPAKAAKAVKAPAKKAASKRTAKTPAAPATPPSTNTTEAAASPVVDDDF